MTDTQWPRYLVFEQEREGAPHQTAGSIHAPDGEMALLNARDIFVRRPRCASLWIVPAERILSRTREELKAEETGAEPTPPDGEPGAYHVFRKLSARGPHVHAGDVEAGSPESAMRKALTEYPDEKAMVWWIVPAGAVIRSDPAEAASLFDPAETKTFRDPGEYHPETLMREARRRAREAEESKPR